MRSLWERVGFSISEDLVEEQEEGDTQENVNDSRTAPNTSPLLGQTGIEPSVESHNVSPAAQESQPLGESGIEPTLESSGPGAQGLPLLQMQEESQSEEENEVITEFYFNDKSNPSQEGLSQIQENNLQKISPTIQEKVDQFETDEAKRKADGSPELSKKEKKKSKNRERNVRK